MRSWSAIAPLLGGKARNLAESSGRGDIFLGPFDRLDDDPARIGGVAPFTDADPFLGLKVLIMGEEMLDLLEHDRGQILPFADVGIIRKGRIDRNANQLLVASVLVFEVENADGTSANNAARNEG